MSFADDLRNAKALQEKEEEMQVEQDWNKLIDLLCNWLKENCQATARYGTNYIDREIWQCFHEHRDECADVEDDEWSWDVWEDKEWWQRIFYRISAKQHPYRSSDRRIICFSEEDSKDISAQLTSRLQADGLSVQIREHKIEIYRQEVEYKEYKGTGKALAGIFSILDYTIDKDGYEEKKSVLDHYRYELSIKISW